MVTILNAMLVFVLLLNLFVLGTSRIRSLVQCVALQGVALGVMPLLVHGRLTPMAGLVGIATVLLKGSIIPQILFKALRDVQIKREIEPIIGFMPSTLLGALGTALAIGLSTKLPLAGGHAQTLVVPAALSTVFTGFLLLTSRIKAITQAIGYLVLENGIFTFGVGLVRELSLLVELGVLLDVFVAVFVMGIMIFHISREFDHLDTDRLSTLRD